MGKCILCQTNPMYFYNLCDDCEKIKKLMTVYEPDIIHRLINETLLVNASHADKRLKRNLDVIETKTRIISLKKKDPPV